MNNIFSRRTLLRGAGVALALPWMESLVPRNAGAAAATSPTRYMPIYMPNGAPDFWVPQGTLTNWQLGSILQPFTALQAKVNVLQGMENGSAFNKDGSNSVEPSHGRQPGAWLTCVDAYTIKAQLNTSLEANGVSVDQIMALHQVFAGKTALPSMQVGLSTVHSSCDGPCQGGAACQCSNSRSVSWHTETQPLYKQVDPLTVFNLIAGVAMPSTGTATAATTAAAAKAIALKKSVLDGVLSSATATRARLSVTDQQRMDEFLSAVRDTEMLATQVSAGMGGMACTLGPAPTMKTVTEDGIRQTTATYNKGDHADAMNALIVLALQCDVTRIITYMLEDERSEFVYDNVPRRTFTPLTSTQVSGTCPEWHTGGQHGDPNDYGAITLWNMGKVADLCTKMDAIKEANGLSMLDNTVISFGCCMHGSDHACNRIPTLLIGGGGGKLKTGQYVDLGNRPIRDLHYTVMNSVFGMAQTTFGANLTGAPLATINEVVATPA
jgi:hypothetical protein